MDGMGHDLFAKAKPKSAVMKKHNTHKIKEPFDPQQTPKQAQFPDPRMRSEEDMSNRKKEEDNKQDKKGSGKQLGDETEIDDETTI